MTPLLRDRYPLERVMGVRALTRAEWLATGITLLLASALYAVSSISAPTAASSGR
ncbi:MAG: hypothetical protein ACR2OG_17460 [Gemmatimonadaceae bacterium]